MNYNFNTLLQLYFQLPMSEIAEYFGYPNCKDKVEDIKDCPFRSALVEELGKNWEFEMIKNKPSQFPKEVLEEAKKIIFDIRNTPKRLNEKIFEEFCTLGKSFTTLQDIGLILHKTPEELTECIQSRYPQYNAAQYLDIIYKGQKHLLRQEQIRKALTGDSKMLISVGETYLEQKVNKPEVNLTISISKLIEQERKVIDAEFEDVTNQKKLSQLP